MKKRAVSVWRLKLGVPFDKVWSIVVYISGPQQISDNHMVVAMAWMMLREHKTE